MKNTIPQILLSAVGVIVVTILIGGCQEEQNQLDPKTDVKMARLMAVKTAALEKQIEQMKKQHQRELDKERALHDKEIRRQEKLLERCQQEKVSLDELSRGGVKAYMDDIVGPLADENIKLRKEIEALKAQVEQLKQRSSG